MGVLFAILSALSFGLNNLIVKKGMALTPTTDNGYFVTVVLNVIILGIAYGFHQLLMPHPPEFNSIAILFFILSGFLTTGLGRFTFFSTISYLGPSRASALKNGSPLFTLLFALIVLHETLSWQSGTAIFLILAGIAVLGWNTFTKFKGKSDRFGYYLGITSALCFGVGQAVRKNGLEMMNDAFLGAWVGAVTSLIFLVIYEASKGRLPKIIKENQSLIHNRYFLTAGFLNSLGPLFFFLGASYTSVSIVSAVAAVEPLLTVIISRYLFQQLESLSWVIYTAACLVFVGTVVMVF